MIKITHIPRINEKKEQIRHYWHFTLIFSDILTPQN